METSLAIDILERLALASLDAEADDDDAGRIMAALAALFLTAWLTGMASVLTMLGRIMSRQGSLDADDIAEIQAEARRALAVRFEASTAADRLDMLELAYDLAAEEVADESISPVTAALRLGGGQDFDYLEKHTTYWVRSYYDRQLAGEIAALGDDVLRQGLSRFEAGGRFEEAFSARLGESAQYWQSFAGHVTTRTQEFARVAQYERAGRSARIQAVLDDRTSEICRFLHGKRIPLALMVEARDALLASESPDDVRRITPWLAVEEARLYVQGDTITDARLAMPPYHFGCRTRTIVA